VIRATRAILVLMDNKVQREIREKLEHKALRDCEERLDLKVCKVLRVIKVTRVIVVM
jgi:hypothetical protein